MKNIKLLLTVSVSVVAGYLLYPYLNKSDPYASRERARTSEKYIPGTSNLITERNSKLSGSKKESALKHGDERNELFVDSGEDKVSSRNSVRSKELSKDIKASGKNSFSDSASQSYGAQVARDFSYYRLSETRERLELSSGDPRLKLIQGYYAGIFNGNPVDLEIGSSDSSPHFFNETILNEELSFDAPNDRFFTNVHNNGNLLLIDNGKTKMFIDIKNWPELKLMTGLKTEILLRKKK